MSAPTPPPIPLSTLLCDLISTKIALHEYPTTTGLDRIAEICEQIDVAYPAVSVTVPEHPYVINAIDSKGNPVQIRSSEFTHHP